MLLKGKYVYFWLVIYIFLAVFQPQITSVTTIYVFGILTIGLIVWEEKANVDMKILKMCNMKFFIQILAMMLVYLVVISVINTTQNRTDLFINRLRCINQLIILTAIQLASIYYVALISKKHYFQLKDIINILITVGILQGCCAVLAYLVPEIRIFFLRHIGNIYFEQYMWERRGYGFASMLIDVFGYGMGLLAGYALLSSCCIVKLSKKILAIALMLFSIIFNARTGLIVFLVAVMLQFFKHKSKAIVFCKMVLMVIGLVFFYFWIAPVLIEKGMESSNVTVKWIVSAFKQIYDAIGAPSGSNVSFSFISNRVSLSGNIFELIFGSGHSIYGTKNILGFASDIGYLNLLWIYGILGTAILFVTFLKLFYCTYKKSRDIDIKCMAILNAVAYFLVLIKGNLLGYNPGTCVTYYFTFLIPFFYNLEGAEEKKNSLRKGGRKEKKNKLVPERECISE